MESSAPGAWIFRQFQDILIIMGFSLALAVSANTIRHDPLPWVAERRLLEPGDRFPYFPLASSEIPEFRDYLGLPPDKEIITVADIQADLLVVEILNVFCFPCQTQALTLNRVWKIIEHRPDLKGKIKIIGIALGNTKEMVRDFSTDYGLSFPVFSDADARSEKIIGPGIHTPFSLYIRRDGSGRLTVVAGTHSGVIEDPGLLLKTLTRLLPEEERPASDIRNGEAGSR
ncbi:MAG: hypothetical protein DRH37_02645 [Deltaproteobacteria bacterium]|nr:MAG: hypothetical protein DRH37_02645 [Deltaproteobacteria bacterium]